MSFMLNFRSRRRISALIVFAIIFAMFIGLLTSVAVTANAATLPSVMWLQGSITEVSDLDSGISQCSADIGYAINTENASVAIPVDLRAKSDGTVQFRMFCTNNVIDSFRVYVINKDDIYSAKRISGTITIGYSGVSKSNTVQGVESIDNGHCIWNIPLTGGKEYYIIVENTRTTALETDKEPYGFSDVCIEMVYKAGNTSTDKQYLSSGNLFRGMLTLTNPELTYYLKTNQSSAVTLYFTFDGEAAKRLGTGSIQVTNQYGELIATQNVSAASASTKNEFKLTLDAMDSQTYTVKMSGIYGATTIRAEQNVTSVTLSKSTDSITNKLTVDIAVSGIDVSSMSYVNKQIADNMLSKESSWSGCKHIDGESFEVTENGTYNVRVYDGKKYYYANIIISNIDDEAPNIDNTINMSANKVKINVIDDNIKEIKLNGRKIVNGAYINETGTHTLIAVDKAGNQSSKTIYIDREAPVIKSGVLSNKAKVEAGYYTFEVSDGISGIDYVLVDGEELSSYGKTYGFNVNKTHSVVVADKCGNTTTWTIYCTEKASGSGSSGNSSSGSGIGSNGGATGGSGTIN